MYMRPKPSVQAAVPRNEGTNYALVQRDVRERGELWVRS